MIRVSVFVCLCQPRVMLSPVTVEVYFVIWYMVLHEYTGGGRGCTVRLGFGYHAHGRT